MDAPEKVQIVSRPRSTSSRPAVIKVVCRNDWQRRGRAHFVSQSAYETWRASRHGAEKAESLWTKLGRLLQSK